MRYSSIIACLAASVFAAPTPTNNEARALSDIPAFPTTTPAAGYASAVDVTNDAISTLQGVQSQASTPDPGPLLTSLTEIAIGVVETLGFDMLPLQGLDTSADTAQLSTLLAGDQSTITDFQTAMSSSTGTQAEFESAVANAISGFQAALAAAS